MCGASWPVRLEPGRGALGDARTNFLGKMEQYGLSRQAAVVTAIRRDPPLRLAGGWGLDARQRTAVEHQQTATASFPQGVWLIESKHRAESGFIPI